MSSFSLSSLLGTCYLHSWHKSWNKSNIQTTKQTKYTNHETNPIAESNHKLFIISLICIYVSALKKNRQPARLPAAATFARNTLAYSCHSWDLRVFALGSVFYFFCITHFTTYQRFVANKSAICPFLVGILEIFESLFWAVYSICFIIGHKTQPFFHFHHHPLRGHFLTRCGNNESHPFKSQRFWEMDDGKRPMFLKSLVSTVENNKLAISFRFDSISLSNFWAEGQNNGRWLVFELIADQKHRKSTMQIKPPIQFGF